MVVDIHMGDTTAMADSDSRGANSSDSSGANSDGAKSIHWTKQQVSANYRSTNCN
jgi:hypothetical protein